MDDYRQRIKPHTLSWRGRALELGRRTAVMGIVNVTPDSFSDGGRYYAVNHAVEHALRLVRDGADIIDIGGESTRPFSAPVSVDEEMKRVVPVIEDLSAKINVPISIDTTKAEVADAALLAGAAMVNDVSAFRLDPRLAKVTARHGVPVILMHMRGEPRTMQISPTYQDVAAEVRAFLQQAITIAVQAGIDRNRIIIDPGIGFGKTGTHNLLLIQQLKTFQTLKAPILVGASRKAFIRKLLSPPNAGELDPDHPDVETGTQAVVAAAVLNGAQIVRVHDVARTRLTLALIDAIRDADPQNNCRHGG